ncbi:hypothetical protein OG885_38075 [Streptomyces sp. NBC_00028]|uniref:hypothetical protein n=1 Tax=Streptomyces sp. NBC_00028 TaxID=2975624 RepID=UPI0032546CBE
MTIRGALTVELSGPYEARTALLDAFAAESIAARYITPQAVGPDEEGKGWVRAEFHEGTDSPSADFGQDCLSRCTSIGQQFGYVLRSHGVVIGGAAQMRHIVDTRTGELVIKGFNVGPEFLAIISEETGIPVKYLDVREPPGMWDVPEA